MKAEDFTRKFASQHTAGSCPGTVTTFLSVTAFLAPSTVSLFPAFSHCFQKNQAAMPNPMHTTNPRSARCGTRRAMLAEV